MKRWALCLVAMFGCALIMESQAFAASVGLQSGTGNTGTRAGARGARGPAPGGLPRGGFVRPVIPGAGLREPGPRGQLGDGRFAGGIGRFGAGEARFGSGIGRFRGGEGRFRGGAGRFDDDRDEGRFGRGIGRFDRDGDERRFRRFGGGIYAGVTGFVPLPDLLGLPYYDGFEYPYFFPDTSAPYLDDIYGFPPPAAGYPLPPQTDYFPPPSPNGAIGAGGPQVWYYCQNPMGYYPYVRDCNSNWQAVPASVLPPPPPQ